MPSFDVGVEVLRNRALNCCPWVRSLTQSPVAVLSGRDRGGMTNQGDQITVPTGLNPYDTKAVVGVLISDALNQSSQCLAIGWCGFHIHDIRHTRPFSKSGLPEKTC
jgi:hypothetical protein